MSDLPVNPAVWRKWVRGILLVVLSVAATQGLTALGVPDDYDRMFYDTWHAWADRRSESSQVALVAVDDQTLVMLADEPRVFWGPRFAQAIRILREAGVRVIGLDFLFMVSAERCLEKMGLGAGPVGRTFDAPFRAELASGAVVLIAELNLTNSGQEVMRPIDEFLYALPNQDADLGFDNLIPDQDGVVRHLLPAIFDQGPAPRVTFGTLLALKAMGLDPGSEKWRLGELRLSNEPTPLPIGYSGPPGTFEPVSFARLLTPDATKDPVIKSLKDKVVIIGSTHKGAQDRHLTPYGKRELMYGAEVQANIVQTLLTGRFPVRVAWSLGALAVLLVAAIGAFAFFRLSPAWGAVVAVGLAALFCGVAFLLFLGDSDLPVGPGHLALALCYLGTIGLRLTGEERRRLHLRRMFGQYVSDAVVEKLLSSGRQPDLGGEMVTATVLFSDIRNFTTIAERLTAHEVVEMLNTYFGRVCDAIFAEEGTVDKFVGDAIMAVFGSPVPHADHARRALRAALSMDRIAVGFRSWLTERFAARSLPEFDIGIGVHTGDAVIGNIGSPKRLEFTAIGDTVNTTARLESLTKQLGARILISESTAAAAGPGLILGKRHRVKVKGREEEVEVIEFRGLEEDDEGSREPTE